MRSPVGDDIENIPVESPDEHLWIHDLEVAFKAGGLLKSGWDINGYLLSYFERIPQPIFKFPASPPAAGVPPTRGNSNQPVGSVSAVTLRLNEPRVFTLGLTATQSAGDYVYRGELALHTNRALPDVPSTKASLADQAVFHGTTDVTFSRIFSRHSKCGVSTGLPPQASDSSQSLYLWECVFRNLISTDDSNLLRAHLSHPMAASLGRSLRFSTSHLAVLN